MAKQYVLAHRIFASNFDASSFISYQYIIAAQASSGVKFPRSAWGCKGGPGDVIGTGTSTTLNETAFARAFSIRHLATASRSGALMGLLCGSYPSVHKYLERVSGDKHI